MLILEDTRQKECKHKRKHEYFRSVGIYWNRTALYCGDYTLPTNQSVCVDTKKDIAELIGDIQTKKMPKREVHKSVYDICEMQGFSFNLAEEIYHAIYDNDETRFAEKEINDICFKNSIPERTVSDFQSLYDKVHGFFHRGLKRAQNGGIRLIILVENEDGIASVAELSHWENPRKERYLKIKEMHSCGKWMKIPLPKKEPMTGLQLAKSCQTMNRKYGVEFQFCRPEESGKRILEILGIEV